MATHPSTSDDLDAVRTVVEALKHFEASEQRRIIRWAEEKLGLASAAEGPLAPARGLSTPSVGADAQPARISDIRSFVQQKQPATDIQFAAVVAYFHAFEAPVGQRKADIGPAELQDAARLAARPRLRRPITTLHNAARLGYLDKAKGRAKFRINTVGENLVAMALPGKGGESTDIPRRNRKKKKKTKR